MDILAAIEGLKALKTRCKVTLYNNNGYLVDAMANNWALCWQANNWKNSEQKPTAKVDLWEQLLLFCSQHDVEFIRIKQCTGNQEYQRCNYISRQAANQQNLPADEGYQRSTPLGKPYPPPPGVSITNTSPGCISTVAVLPKFSTFPSTVST